MQDGPIASEGPSSQSYRTDFVAGFLSPWKEHHMMRGASFFVYEIPTVVGCHYGKCADSDSN